MTNQKLINQKEFLEKYNLSKEYFDATKLTWDELEKIYVNYLSEMDNMDNAIQPTIKILMSIENIHSVRYRIKKPEHVIRKIIKKKKDNPELVIGVDNYKTILTDLIGLRALHLFKEDAYSICLALKGKFGSPCETPVLYYGAGDSKKYREEFELSGYQTKCHNNYYRSIHHIIKTPHSGSGKNLFYRNTNKNYFGRRLWRNGSLI